MKQYTIKELDFGATCNTTLLGKMTFPGVLQTHTTGSIRMIYHNNITIIIITVYCKNNDELYNYVGSFSSFVKY
jgi:hypothetical protein